MILTLSLSSVYCAELKIGRVDVQKVLLTVKEGKEVNEKLKSEFMKKQKIFQEEEAKARKLQEDFEKQRLVMNDKAKEKKIGEIQQAIVALQQKQVSFQNEIQEMERTLKTPITQKIQKIVQELSTKHKLDLAFEAMSSGVLYSKEKIDLTDEVIKVYDSKHK